ncbi:MAG: hypothetical protein QM764_17160 [Chitinophagaceae bacterium]
MSFNILKTSSRYLNPEVISKASIFLQENEINISNAFSSILPITLTGFVIKANASSDNASDILDIVIDSYKNGIADNIVYYFDNIENRNKSLTLERALLGDKLNSILDSISYFANIEKSSTSVLFNLATSLVAAVIGKYSTDMNLSAMSLASFLHGQKTNILSGLPIELAHTARLLELTKISDLRKHSTLAHPALFQTKKRKSWKLFNWLCLLLIILIAWYCTGKRHTVNHHAAKHILTKTVFMKSRINFFNVFNC